MDEKSAVYWSGRLWGAVCFLLRNDTTILDNHNTNRIKEKALSHLKHEEGRISGNYSEVGQRLTEIFYHCLCPCCTYVVDENPGMEIMDSRQCLSTPCPGLQIWNPNKTSKRGTNTCELAMSSPYRAFNRSHTVGEKLGQAKIIRNGFATLYDEMLTEEWRVDKDLASIREEIEEKDKELQELQKKHHKMTGQDWIWLR